MPPTIPQVLLPYLLDASSGSLLLVTSVLNAPANWLVVRCISAALHRDQHARSVDYNGTVGNSVSRKVVLLSLLRPLSLWTEIGKKEGVDIPLLLAKRQLVYIDGLDCYGKDAPLGTPAPRSSLPGHALKEVQTALERAIEASYEHSQTGTATTEPTTEAGDTSGRPVLIIDGLDFLIASQPEVTATVVSQMLTSIRQRVHSTRLSITSDGPLLHGNSGARTALEQEHQAFVSTLAHQSQLVFQLRGLDTGIAKDISGVIRISHGGGHEEDVGSDNLVEGEWLYKVSGDGSVRVWGRGE